MGDDQDTEMGDDTRQPAPAASTELRRASATSSASRSSAVSYPGTVLGSPLHGQPPPGSANTSRRSSLANLVHDMDMEVGTVTHEVIRMESEDDDDDDDDDEEEEDGQPVQDGEEEDEPFTGDGVEAEEAEDEEDEDDDSDDSEDDDDGTEDETDVPTTTPTASTAGPSRGRPRTASPPRPNTQTFATPTNHNTQPPMRSSISISELTENGIEGPIHSPAPSSGDHAVARKGISIPVLLHPSDDHNNGIAATAPEASQTESIPINPSISPPLPGPSAAPNADGFPPSASVPVSKKAKPRSKAGKQRTPSPSPPPPPPLPPMQTIRLKIKLGGPSNYEVDVSQQAKDTGQRPATPPLPPGLTIHESEEEKEKEPPPEEGGPRKRRKKKNAAQEYYDTTDPFIDDSELAVDQRTYFAQTKQQGFYVSSGEVALMKDTSPKKTKSKKPLSTAVGPQATLGGGQKRDALGHGNEAHPSPIEEEQDHLGMSKGLKGVGITNGQNNPGDVKGKKVADGVSSWTGAFEEDGDEKTGQKRKRYITVVEGGKKRKIVNINSFHPDLQVAIEEMKQSIAKENWEQKGKFPPTLKPQLGKLALLAIQLDEYDDHFFNLMPILFPYNKFTMTKLIKRTMYTDHIALLQDRQDLLLKQLEDIAKAGFSKAEEEWEKSVAQWDKKQEKIRLETANPGSGSGADGNGAAGSGSGTGSAAPTRHPTEEKEAMEVDNTANANMSISAQGAGNSASVAGVNPAHTAHPPAKKYRLTEHMKAIIWDLVLLSNECCRLENEKNGYEGSVIQVSEQGLRKVLYQKIVAAFPDGWMSSGQISRDVSAMKKRLEREALENEG